MNYQIGNYISTEYGELPIKHVVFDSYQVTGKDGRILLANKVESTTPSEKILVAFCFYYSDDDNEFLELQVVGKFKFYADKSDNFKTISYRVGGEDRAFMYINSMQNFYECVTGKKLKLTS